MKTESIEDSGSSLKIGLEEIRIKVIQNQKIKNPMIAHLMMLIRTRKHNGWALVQLNSQIAQNIVVKLIMANSMVLVAWFTQTEIYIKVIGKMVWHMVRVFSVMFAVDIIQGIGRMINSMVKVLKLGNMVQLNMKVISKKARRLEKVNFGSKEAHIKVISLMVSSMEKANIIFQNPERYMMVILQIIN